MARAQATSFYYSTYPVLIAIYVFFGCAYLFGWISLGQNKKVYPVDKDMKMAIKYLYKAAKQGDENALENLREIRKNTVFDDIRTEAPPEGTDGNLFR